MIDEAFVVNMIKAHDREIADLKRQIRELRSGRGGARGVQMVLYDGITKASINLVYGIDSISGKPMFVSGHLR